MTRNIIPIFTFIAGVALGVAASYKIASTKYANIADEEIASVKERFSDRLRNEQKSVKQCDDTLTQESKETHDKYKVLVSGAGYDTIDTSTKGDIMKKKPTIYTISPDEFDTLDDYRCETLYYSSDNYVLDSCWLSFSDQDILDTIGADPIGMFGEYEDDSAYVRNEDRMCDYEILLSEKTCAEIQQE